MEGLMRTFGCYMDTTTAPPHTRNKTTDMGIL